ncbi:hypothetical protein HanRHA438_Chr15g0727561 [Helianthus annuus]|uniref:Uncharacterized protein n=1 Tax=Helianthus annuus TaxID=4232 RepID=A0A251SCD1_HELAN|nr:uncharacterized protein LOC110912588 [Helianthus annuus]KAF5766432.1 hypothetical protein HanXRQr2_Chr15g0715321 [Helianthus annuus]KAJ0452814.1 hypothetical protein HanHA300_Chr15g0583281 [Helianthus annuus]KAJ0457828.1 hypothetical protein HanIR_Chr15g0778211 [Helianthus annuus]KAJ0474728.1 hypothetical protein HanHA89_Chr15g0633071 [Helianthus annuus]KAJ0650282.1 hypothetical protein HanLR1_Chr15g0593971 [Helianthus annuus]
MIRREGKGPSSRDLLVCFPTRAHLALMPKPASSPRRHLHHHQKHLRKSMRGGSTGGHASPYMWSGTKQMGSDNLSEPTSPKVTCAGQIKVRPSTRSCKNWQTVMEEIERIHINRKKKSTWVEAFGFKKEVMQFLSCLRSIKFDFRCLGAFSHVDITSDDEEEDDEYNNDKEINQHDKDHHDHDINEEVSSGTMFSKWFMVLQENQDCGIFEKDEKSLKPKETEDHHHPCLPPPNALLLMRCRSAPAKSWMEEKEEEEEQQEKYDDDHYHDHDHDDDHDQEHEEHAKKDQKLEHTKSKRKSLSELMKNESDFYKLSVDVAKETWVIGGIHKDPFSRSRSWRR